MKVKNILLIIGLVWLFVGIWVVVSKFSSQNKWVPETLTIYSQDGVEMGELFGLDDSDHSDQSQQYVRIIETVRSLLSDSMGEKPIGGLKVQTTIDSEFQHTAARLVDESIASEPALMKDIGVVVLDNETGAILATVGGILPADFSAKDNLVYDLKFKVGSMVVPFIYSVAVDKGGLLPGEEIELGEKVISVNEALNSLDLTAAEIMGEKVGETKLNNLMNALHLNTSGYVKAEQILQGDFKCALISLTSAYSTLAKDGRNFSPYLLERVESIEPKTLFANSPRSKKIYDPGLSSTLTSMMKSESNLYLVSADNWCVGFTDKVTIGIVAVDGSAGVDVKLRAICKEIETVAGERGWQSTR